MILYVAPIVEGITEQACIEPLLQRVWTGLLGRPERLQIVERVRARRDQLLHRDGKVLIESLEQAVVNLRLKAKGHADAKLLTLILIDAEKGGCPASLGSHLLGIAKSAVPPDVSTACVVAKRMFENWIVAGASSLGGVNGLPNPLPTCDDSEAFDGAAWLNEQLRTVKRARKYKKTTDAEVFIRSMNVRDCRTNSPSFDKLCRELAARIPELPIDPNPVEPPPDEST